MSGEDLKFTADRRDRLGGAILGAPGKELVVVRASDLRACLGLADQVAEAQRLIGENDRLERELALARALAMQIPVLHEHLAGAKAGADALLARIDESVKLLKGRA